MSLIARNNQLTWSTYQLSACQAVVKVRHAMPSVERFFTLWDLEAPLMMMSWRG